MTEQVSEMTEEQRKQLEEKIKNMSPEELAAFQQQQCIFCQIIAGKIPSKKVYEDDKIVGILDINPAAKGHILLLPKEHYAIMPQMPVDLIGDLFLIGKKLSQIQLRALKVTGTNLFIANGLAAGQRAQHFMLHIIPRVENDGLLELDEKLVAKEMQQKVVVAVEEKLNELLGVKKDIVRVQKDEPAPPIEEELDDEIVEPEEPEVDTEEDDQEGIEDEASDEDDSEEEHDSDEEAEEDEGDADLDDIANLFK